MRWQQKYFGVYTAYIINYDAAVIRLKKVRKKSNKLVVFLDEQKNRPESRKLDLDSLLIMPVQRIPRYVLLLKDLLKNTDDTHRDWPHLQRAVERMQETAEDINEKKRDAENLNQLLKIAAHLPEELRAALVRKHRVFVKECKGVQVQRESGGAPISSRLFLFNDLLLLTARSKRSGPPAQFRLEHLVVRDVDATTWGLALKPGAAPQPIELDALPGLGAAVPISASGSTASALLSASDLPLRIVTTPEEKTAWVTEMNAAIDSLLTAHIACKPAERLGKAPQPRAGAVSWVDDAANRLYMHGGADAGVVLADLAALDLKTNQWSLEQPAVAGAEPAPPRAFHAAVALADGGALLFGGQDKAGAPLADLYRYDKKQLRKLEPGGELPSGRFGHALVLDAGTNTALCFGGCSSDGPLNDVYSYDIAKNKWALRAAKGEPPAARQDACVALIGNVLVVAGGCVRKVETAGEAAPPRYFSGAEVHTLDLGSGSWSVQKPAGAAPPAKLLGVGLMLDDELVALGEDERGARLLYRLSNRTGEWLWERNIINGAVPAAARSAFAMALHAPSKTVHVFGGLNGKIYSGDMFRLQLARIDPLQLAREADAAAGSPVAAAAAPRLQNSTTTATLGGNAAAPAEVPQPPQPQQGKVTVTISPSNNTVIPSPSPSNSNSNSNSGSGVSMPRLLETSAENVAGPVLRRDTTRMGPPSPLKVPPGSDSRLGRDPTVAGSLSANSSTNVSPLAVSPKVSPSQSAALLSGGAAAKELASTPLVPSSSSGSF